MNTSVDGGNRVVQSAQGKEGDEKITEEEKLKLLSCYENLSALDTSHFNMLTILSEDEDDFIRSQAAALLINFETEESKKILLHISQDKDAFVRTEAYDSLSVFYDDEVQKFLEKSMKKEDDSLACRYAIFSWINVSLNVSSSYAENIKMLKQVKKIVNSDEESLACCYGFYLFGEENTLMEILSFLKSADYHVRCTTIALLNEIRSEKNVQIIKEAMIQLLLTETAIAVRERAEKLLREC